MKILIALGLLAFSLSVSASPSRFLEKLKYTGSGLALRKASPVSIPESFRSSWTDLSNQYDESFFFRLKQEAQGLSFYTDYIFSLNSRGELTLGKYSNVLPEILFSSESRLSYRVARLEFPYLTTRQTTVDLRIYKNNLLEIIHVSEVLETNLKEITKSSIKLYGAPNED